ncbi:hypothetical protein CDAR_92891 [Caerostris darwini]|uniref:Uncharacterized protein n=1 Tax=Caerostris darwini TaxID=1538125 RepID=A0AAV4PKM3_9ARAC|nr:hypothetical protein CDAR_92891 [Caerostris darwini]
MMPSEKKPVMIDKTLHLIAAAELLNTAKQFSFAKKWLLITRLWSNFGPLIRAAAHGRGAHISFPFLANIFFSLLDRKQSAAAAEANNLPNKILVEAIKNVF